MDLKDEGKQMNVQNVKLIYTESGFLVEEKVLGADFWCEIIYFFLQKPCQTLRMFTDTDYVWIGNLSCFPCVNFRSISIS